MKFVYLNPSRNFEFKSIFVIKVMVIAFFALIFIKFFCKMRKFILLENNKLHDNMQIGTVNFCEKANKSI